MAEGRAVDPAVVRGLEEYLDLLEVPGALPDDEIDADDLLITFCREIYNQFFVGVLREQLGEPGLASRIRVVTLRKRGRQDREWTDAVDAVVHGYLKFCPLYLDLFSGLKYEREDAIGSFHIGFMPKMLDEFWRWAASVPDAELVKALGKAKSRYLEIVEEWRHDWDD